MSVTYSYKRSLHRHRLWRIFIAFIGLILVIVLGWLAWQHYNPASKVISGATVLVPQDTKNEPVQTFNETLFTIQLPSDWKLNSSTPQKYAWQSTLKGSDNRYLTLYIDQIPSSYAINKELPLTVSDNQVMYGTLSTNCANFTPGGTLNVAQAEKLQPAVSVWQGVNFICNLPQVVDNQIGTGEAGDSVNSTAITGPIYGTHQYFFLYIDRNAEPDYTVLYNAIESFRVK